MQLKDYASNWQVVCETYDETRDKSPAFTADVLLEKMCLSDALETFSAVAAIKRHDGRIYGANRAFIETVPHMAEAEERSHVNPLFTAKLDHIHTAHIDQLIGELKKRREAE